MSSTETDPTTRRQFLATATTALGATAAVAPGVATADCDGIEYERLLLLEDGYASRDLNSGRCSVHQSFLDRLGAEAGDQLRLGVTHADEDATYDELLVTVDEAHEDAYGVVYAASDDLDLLGVAGFDIGRASATIPHPCYDDREDADEHDELVEVLEEGRDDASIVVLAPHGGYVELGSGRQAAYANEAYGLPAWICYAYDGAGAFDRWHVTSTAVSDASFPHLARVSERGYETALAVHGRSDFDDHDEEFVGVGGRHETAKAAVAAAIEDAYETAGVDVPVRVLSDGEYAGTHEDNVVNRIPAGESGGVQLEQPWDVRQDHAELTIDAAIEAMRSVLSSDGSPGSVCSTVE